MAFLKHCKKRGEKTPQVPAFLTIEMKYESRCKSAFLSTLLLLIGLWLNYFMSLASSYAPLKTSQNYRFFYVFRGVWKETSSMKWEHQNNKQGNLSNSSLN